MLPSFVLRRSAAFTSVLFGIAAFALMAPTEAAEVFFSATAPLNSDAAADAASEGYPCLAYGGDRKWMALWTSSNDGDGAATDYDILSCYSMDNGATWGPLYPVNSYSDSDTGNDFRPSLAADRAGRWVAVWMSYHSVGGTGTDGDILSSYSISNGAFWYPAVVVNHRALVDSSIDTQPVVVTDGAGTWVCAWQSSDTLGGTIGGEGDILFARSTNGGLSWSNAQPLNTNADVDGYGDYDARMATDGAVWIAVWGALDDLGGVIGNDYDILFARSVDDGATWSAPAALNTNAAEDTGADLEPDIATDGQGHWVCLWRSSENLGGTIGNDPDLLASYSTDGGLTWSAPLVVNSNAADDGAANDMGARITNSGAVWVAAWDSPDPLGGALGEDRDILIATSHSLGAFWSPVTPLNATAATDNPSASPETNPDFTVALAAADQGRFLAAWISKNSLGGSIGGDYDVLCAKVIPPQVTAIIRNGASPSNAADVEFAVIFSEAVEGVDLDDFELESHNLVGESMTGVSGSDHLYLVAVHSGERAGVLEVHLRDNDTITDLDGNPLGGYGAGNGDHDSDEVFAIDRLGPEITLLGENPAYFECGNGAYMSPSATAFDTTDGDVTGSINVTGDVDDTTLGPYEIRYHAEDFLGNESEEILVVNVVDTTVPDLALLGDNPLAWDCGVPYDDPGATVTDVCAAAPQLLLDAADVNVNQAGSYTVYLTASDSSSNENYAQRTVVIAEPCAIEGEGEGEGAIPAIHTADQNADNLIDLSELLRVIQFFNSAGFHCQAGTEDGYAPGPGDTASCLPHASDYNPQDWAINLSELLRLIQFFNSGGYHVCPGEGTEDEYCPGPI